MKPVQRPSGQKNGLASVLLGERGPLELIDDSIAQSAWKKRVDFMINDDLLTWGKVRAWAEGLPSGEFAGWPDSAYHCPLAHYLKDATNGKLWRVDINAASYMGEDPIELPEWGREAVRQVDQSPRLERLTREKFLHILDECKPEHIQNRARFISLMRKPEMRLVRLALLDLKHEHGYDWRKLNEIDNLTDTYWNSTKTYNIWYFLSDEYVSICTNPESEHPDFDVYKRHESGNSDCGCGFCDWAEPVEVQS